jgi:hypothetical protein
VQSKTIRRVKITWERAYAIAYRVQISADGTSWADLYGTVSGEGGTDDIKGISGTGRYLRLYATERASFFGYSVWELEAYETP